MYAIFRKFINTPLTPFHSFAALMVLGRFRKSLLVRICKYMLFVFPASKSLLSALYACIDREQFAEAGHGQSQLHYMQVRVNTLGCKTVFRARAIGAGVQQCQHGSSYTCFRRFCRLGGIWHCFFLEIFEHFSVEILHFSPQSDRSLQTCRGDFGRRC